MVGLPKVGLGTAQWSKSPLCSVLTIFSQNLCLQIALICLRFSLYMLVPGQFMLIRVTLILTLEFYVDPSAFISFFSPFPSKCTYVMLENLEDIDLNVV